MEKSKIRFKGYNDAWEQRKLGEISNKVTKKNQDVVVDEVFTNSAEFGIMSQRDFFDKDIANVENIDGYYVVEADDFVYNPRISTTAPFGPIKRNKLDRTGAMSPLYYVFRTHDVDLGYLEYFFQTTCWHSFMRFNGNSGARSDRFAITDKIFNEMPISVPQDIEEQKRIGTFLTELESLITLHQCKCYEVITLKKYMLQKMFPKDGEKEPEIRFSGFTDAWEQRKLCEVAEFNPKAELPDVFEYVDLESVVGTEMISHRTETKVSAPSRAQRLAKKGDVFYQTVRPYQRNNYLFEKPDDNYVFSTGYAQIRPSIESSFLMSYLQTDGFVKIVLDNCTGTSYPAINSSDLANIKISYPINGAEQEKIGAYFSNLDTLITLHQRKCEELQNIKKFMLQNIFI